MEQPRIRRTLDLDCSPSALWQLVTEDSLLSGWLGEDVVVDLRPGGAGRLTDDDGRVHRLAVREVREGERLTFAWWPEDDEQAASEVVFAVEPTGDGSRLVITESRDTGSSWDARLVSLWLSVCALARV
jgi:uncharacterized protein YndB with AHSA1/START domain